MLPQTDKLRQAFICRQCLNPAAYCIGCPTVLLYYCLTLLLSCCPTQSGHAVLATALLSYCLAVLLSYCTTILLSYCLAVLLSCCPTALLSYCLAVLLSCCPTALLSYCLAVQGRIQGGCLGCWSTPPLTSWLYTILYRIQLRPMFITATWQFSSH